MIPILFEDDYLIIVDKPAMVLSQPSFDKKRIPILELVEQMRPDLKGKLFLHHRLDFETSGVFLMSKSSEVNKNLTEMFKAHDFVKTYLCLVRPNKLVPNKKVICEIENETKWKIKNFMAPASGLSNGPGKGKKRMISVRSGGWSAETDFEIILSHEKFFQIIAKPKTGRTHQIRQHLQESSRSILGDNIYGGQSTDVPRLMLHAQKLKFNHPKTKQALTIEALMPQDFKTILEKYK